MSSSSLFITALFFPAGRISSEPLAITLSDEVLRFVSDALVTLAYCLGLLLFSVVFSSCCASVAEGMSLFSGMISPTCCASVGCCDGAFNVFLPLPLHFPLPSPPVCSLVSKTVLIAALFELAIC